MTTIEGLKKKIEAASSQQDCEHKAWQMATMAEGLAQSVKGVLDQNVGGYQVAMAYTLAARASASDAEIYAAKAGRSEAARRSMRQARKHATTAEALCGEILRRRVPDDTQSLCVTFFHGLLADSLDEQAERLHALIKSGGTKYKGKNDDAH